MNKIGTVTESSLHAKLKSMYASPGDRQEEPVMGYLVDILRSEEIIEIQTGNFSSFRPKLEKLLAAYRVRVVIPIAVERHIIRIGKDGSIISRRLSPKKGRVEELFTELVRIPGLLTHPNLIIEAAFVNDEVYWIDDGKGSWRRKRWSIKDRFLVQLIRTREFTSLEDYLKLIPQDLQEIFSSKEFGQATKLPSRQVSRMLYCLRAMNIINVVGRKGKAYIYQRNLFNP